jgi:predicted amidohydrolase
MVRSAAAYHSRMILFPELWTSGYDLANSEKYVLINAEIEIQLQALAEELNIIIGGSYITADFEWVSQHLQINPPRSKTRTSILQQDSFVSLACRGPMVHSRPKADHN